jgi:hypothetical protein
MGGVVMSAITPGREALLALADEIEGSDGLYRLDSKLGEHQGYQLGIKKTAQVIAGLRLAANPSHIETLLAALDVFIPAFNKNYPDSTKTMKEMAAVVRAREEFRRGDGTRIDGDATFYTPPEHGWTCFHCGTTFQHEIAAREHFGATPILDPACQIKAGEGGLVRKVRWLESENSRLNSENVMLKLGEPASTAGEPKP